MTQNEFEINFAVANALPVGLLHVWGLRSVPCDCGAPDCPGWRMELVERIDHGAVFITEGLVSYADTHLN